MCNLLQADLIKVFVCFQAELAERLSSSEGQLDAVRVELDHLREAQISEIEERCREVDSLKAQLQGEVAELQREGDKSREEVKQVKEQLGKCKALNSQLAAERNTLQRKVEHMSRYG